MATNTETASAPAESVETAFGLSPENMAALAAFAENSPVAAEPKANADAPADEPEQAALSQPETEAVEPAAEAPTEEDKSDEPAKPDGDELPAGTPEWAKKRVGQLTARAKSAEEALASLKAEVEALKQGAKKPEEAVTAGSDPLLNHPKLGPLVKAEREAQANRDGAETLLEEWDDNPDGVVEKLVEAKLVKPGTDIVTAKKWLKNQSRIWSDSMQQAMVRTEAVRGEVASETRAMFAADREKALKLYPWHTQTESEERKMAQAIVAQYPDIMKLPNHLTLIGRLVEGEKAELAKSRPAAPAKPTPPRMPGSSPAMPASGTKPAAGSTALNRAKKSGKIDDIAAYMASMS